MDSKVLNSKTIIGIGLILSGVWLFSGGVAHKITEHDYKKSAYNISRIVKDASNAHTVANSMNKNTIISKNIYE
jgi:hypothetical protein